jgi:hypothetical protein
MGHIIILSPVNGILLSGQIHFRNVLFCLWKVERGQRGQKILIGDFRDERSMKHFIIGRLSK